MSLRKGFTAYSESNNTNIYIFPSVLCRRFEIVIITGDHLKKEEDCIYLKTTEMRELAQWILETADWQDKNEPEEDE